MIKKDNVWLTSKTRMQSEKRFKFYNKISHLLLSYYAVVLIITNVYSEQLAGLTKNFSQLEIALAIIILSASLIITGFGFEEKAMNHRECYLRLQKLLSEALDEKCLLEKYDEILSGYPNHASCDFDTLIVDETLWRSKKIKNAEGEIKCTLGIFGRYFFRRLFLGTFILGFFALPASLFFF